MTSVDAQLADELRELMEKCERTIAQKRARIEGLRAEIKDLTSQREACSVLLGTNAGQGEVTEQEEPSRKGRTIADLALIVLSDPDVPPEGLHVTKIAERMLASGWQTTARKPVLSITGTIINDPRFQKTGRNVFRVSEDTRNRRSHSRADDGEGEPPVPK